MAIIVPTIDQITGKTIMVKLRNLIRHFIGFAQSVSDEVTEIEETVSQTVEDVEQAVDTANDASESAQESAQIVAGYNERLTEAESDITTLDDTKADKSTTLGGYGITDAYTKAQVDTQLTNKADKATTLGGYGITDGVTTNTAQNITGAKTFSQYVNIIDGAERGVTVKRTDKAISDGWHREKWDRVYDRNDHLTSEHRVVASSGVAELKQSVYSANNNEGYLMVTASDSTAYASSSYRPYNSANINDVVTIGSLAANPSVVHTTGNETISGLKKFDSQVGVQTGSVYDRLSAVYVNSTYAGYDLLSGNPNDSNNYGGIRVIFNQDTKAVTLELIKVVNGSYSSNLIASL